MQLTQDSTAESCWSELGKDNAVSRWLFPALPQTFGVIATFETDPIKCAWENISERWRQFVQPR
jgi:hypothetical protein